MYQKVQAFQTCVVLLNLSSSVTLSIPPVSTESFFAQDFRPPRIVPFSIEAESALSEDLSAETCSLISILESIAMSSYCSRMFLKPRVRVDDSEVSIIADFFILLCLTELLFFLKLRRRYHRGLIANLGSLRIAAACRRLDCEGWELDWVVGIQHRGIP